MTNPNIPWNYQEAVNIFSTARFPSQGKPLRGRHNRLFEVTLNENGSRCFDVTFRSTSILRYFPCGLIRVFRFRWMGGNIVNRCLAGHNMKMFRNNGLFVKEEGRPRKLVYLPYDFRPRPSNAVDPVPDSHLAGLPREAPTPLSNSHSLPAGSSFFDDTEFYTWVDSLGNPHDLSGVLSSIADAFAPN